MIFQIITHNYIDAVFEESKKLNSRVHIHPNVKTAYEDLRCITPNELYGVGFVLNKIPSKKSLEAIKKYLNIIKKIKEASKLNMTVSIVYVGDQDLHFQLFLKTINNGLDIYYHSTQKLNDIDILNNLFGPLLLSRDNLYDKPRTSNNNTFVDDNILTNRIIELLNSDLDLKNMQTDNLYDNVLINAILSVTNMKGDNYG